MKGNIYQHGGGLRVEGGRLVNDAPCPVMGLQRMAEERKSMKRTEKVSSMAEAHVSANVQSKLMGL